jgi:hypothetical protein
MTPGDIAAAFREAYLRHHSETPVVVGKGINSIRRRECAWELRFGEESCLLPVKECKVIKPLAKLLASRHVSVPLADLVDEETRRILMELPESSDEVLDNEGVARLKSNYEELLISREKYKDDPLVSKEIQGDMGGILAQLKKNVSQGGRRKRKLGRTNKERAWDALTRNMRRLWPRLREAGMPKLAEHLERSISFDYPNLTYQPPANAAPWTIEP